MIKSKIFIGVVWVFAVLTFAIPAIFAYLLAFSNPDKFAMLLILAIPLTVVAIFFFSIPFGPQSWREAPPAR